MAPAADIDRLIEEGLNRYGSGDLDGALLVWEEALVIDPENPQANSYVDYVRMNYDLLATDGGAGVASEDFGIEEEPEYIIEITRELPTGDAPMYVDPTDEGWFMEDEQTQELFAARTRSANMAPVTRTISADLPPVRESAPRLVEIEADEPPELELELGPPVRISAPEVTFESATREYGADDHKPRAASANDFMEDSGSFRSEATPLGFATQETEIKKRELGFVQPTQGPARLEVRLRTPSAPPSDLELGAAGREPSQTERGLVPPGRPPHAPAMAATTTEDDLIKSLPQPRKVTPVRGSQPLTAEAGLAVPALDEDAPRAAAPITRDMPMKPRPPAERPADRAVTKTGDDQLDDEGDDIALPSAATRDLAHQATSPANVIPGFPPGFDEFAINAPTRELGLRQQAATTPPVPKKRAPSVLDEDDVPTSQSDARQIREEHATQKMKPVRSKHGSGGASDGTRTDYVLPFDPIDARSAQILEEIETPGSAPDGESKEDRTRRRITALIERASAYGQGGELDKGVAAVDLALSEDPNSALAQKLIHRNRDAIMNIFQLFLGDLDRQPQLARPLHELSSAPISPRAAFLLSRIDGTLTIDEILDVSGMPRLEAYRHLCQLFLRGILR